MSDDLKMAQLRHAVQPIPALCQVDSQLKAILIGTPNAKPTLEQYRALLESAATEYDHSSSRSSSTKRQVYQHDITAAEDAGEWDIDHPHYEVWQSEGMKHQSQQPRSRDGKRPSI